MEGRAFLPARTARTEKTSWHPQFCVFVVPACLKWTEVSGDTFCNVVVQGIIGYLCDLFHTFAWTLIKRDVPRTLVCQREMQEVTTTTVAGFVWKVP